MKKKILCLLAVILFGILILCACGGEEDYAFISASSNSYWYDGYLYSTDGSTLVYRKATDTEELPLCLDPLCSHSSDECVAYALGANHAIAAVRNRDGEICVFYVEWIMRTENMFQGLWPTNYRLCCLNTQTREKTVLLSERNEQPMSFYIFGNDIYLPMNVRTKNEAGQFDITYPYWKLSLDSGELTELPSSEYDVGRIRAMAEVKGRTNIYWLDFYDDSVLYLSTEDFSERTKVAEGLSSYGSFVVGNYLYYAIEDSEVIPEVEVTAPEDGLTPGATYTVYSEAKKAAYYRLDTTDPDVEPELMYDGVSSAYSSSARLMWATEDKLYVIPYDPVFFEVLDAYAVGDYVNTETDPDKIPVQYEYINARSGMKIIEIDLATGEQREIPTPGFDPLKIMGGDDERLVVEGRVVDMDRICAKIEEEGYLAGQWTYMFFEIQEIPLNP